MGSEEEVECSDASEDSESSEDAGTGEAAGGEAPPKVARLGFFLGPISGALVGVLLSVCPPKGLEDAAKPLVGVTLWMAIWWMTEALPLGVTSLLPLAVFPVLGILKSTEVAPNYSANITWLFFGGFQIAFAVERTGLHRRLAIGVIRIVGTRPHLVILGVMLAVMVLSMFLSNTSTTAMMLPVAEALASAFTEGEEGRSSSFGKALMLGIAYSASSGGLGTLIGTAPNGVLAVQAGLLGSDISFAHWAGFASPLALIMVVLIWLFLTARFKVSTAKLQADHPVQMVLAQRLGPMSQAESRVAVVFALTVFAWMVRSPLVKAFHVPKGRIEDDTIAMAAAITLFTISGKNANGESIPLLDWPSLLRTPWHIIFLFGGGFSIAKAFKNTGLSAWLGSKLGVLDGLPSVLVALVVVLNITFLTEVTSNTATSNVFLPIIGQLAVSLGLAPATLMVPATLAASCAFMLPVATPPNAIVFATKRISMQDMASTGLIINLASAALITAWMFTWGRFWFPVGVAAT